MLLVARQLTAVLAIEADDVRVLDGVDLDVAAGEVIDIVGPSGSGKSTLLRTLARLQPQATGSMKLAGRFCDELRPQQWRREVTLLPQKPVVTAGSVRDNLRLPWSLKVRATDPTPAEKDMRDALDALGLGDVGLDREAVRLSVGQQARLSFARVWLTRPRVLLLDEADAALDEDSTASMSAATARFAQPGDEPAGEWGTAVVRVRHRGDDGIAARRLRLAGGRLQEVPR